MPLRVAILGFYHETNTFSVARTGLEEFKAYQYAEGATLLERYQGTGTELGGMIRESLALGFELVPIFFAAAVPSGLITSACFSEFIESARRGLAGAGALDGVLVVLHGAAVAEGVPNADGAFLEALRSAVSPRCPIVATTDFHANISEDMVEHADAIIGYDTYPHTDMAARGAEAAGILTRLAAGTTLFKAHVKLPLVTAPQCQSTDDEPMRSVMQDLHEAESRPGIVSASIAMGFPYADSPYLGASVLTYGIDRTATESVAREIAERIWNERTAFLPQLIAPDEVAGLIGNEAATPVVLVDPADNVGGGSAGDGTVILEQLLNANAQEAVVVICDPEAAAGAAAIGIGGTFSGPVGGRVDRAHGAPVMLSGRVTYVADTSFSHSGSYMKGFVTRMGLTAIVEVGGVRVVLTTLRTMPFDVEQLRCLDIEPASQRVIVVKAAIAWRAAYGPVARSVHFIDTPGICPSNLHRLDYAERPYPLFPLESDANHPMRSDP